MSSAYPWEVHLDRSVCLSGTLKRGQVIIGAHGCGFDAVRPNAIGVEAARSVIKSSAIGGGVEDITDAVIADFNNASNGPIDLIYSLRWPDAGDNTNTYDDPPDITSSDYTTKRDLIVAALGGTEAQILINRNGLTLGFFNEIGGGPGTFGTLAAAQLGDTALQAAAYAAHNRGLALATALKAYILANVANADKIKWHGPGFTNSVILDPDYVPTTGIGEARRTFFQDWTDWCNDNGAAIDLHLHCESVEDAESQIQAAQAYCTANGYTFRWCSNEFGPSHYTPRSDLVGAEAVERALWPMAMSYNPVHLCRAPFFENPTAGQAFVWSSIIESDGVTPRWPFAYILADQLAIQTSSVCLTEFTLPFTDSTIDCAVASNDFGDDAGATPEILSNDGTTVSVEGPWDGGCMKLGRLYTFRVQLSQVFRRRRDGSADADAWYTIRRIITRFRDSGPYTLRCTMPNRTDRSVTFEQDDDVTEAIGTFKAWMQGNSEDIEIYIESTSPKPVTVTSVEIIADYDPKNETM